MAHTTMPTIGETGDAAVHQQGIDCGPPNEKRLARLMLGELVHSRCSRVQLSGVTPATLRRGGDGYTVTIGTGAVLHARRW